ncbi:Uncharacterised protein [Streptococcus pneumoniae]|nr:Uncharacterised protein [Streptococcus pneumoniae]SNF13499.1 Uncharacterised protein [Streptococcus pneumoniae]
MIWVKHTELNFLKRLDKRMLRQFRLGFFDVRMTECHLKWKERENFHDFLKFYCKDS